MTPKESPLAGSASMSISIVLFLIMVLPSCGSPSALSITPTFTEVLQDPTRTSLPTLSPSLTPTVPPSPTATPTPIGGSGILLVGLIDTTKPCSKECPSLGVFAFDLGTRTLTRITEEGFALEAVSTGGHRVLFTLDGRLITANADGSEQNTVAQNLSGYRGFPRALWIPETDRILFIGRDQGQDFIYSVRGDGADLRRITQQDSDILQLYETYSSSQIMWEEGFFSSAGVFNQGTWRANIDGSNQELLENISAPAFSPTGTRLVASKFTAVAGIYQSMVFIMESDLSGEVQLAIPLEGQIIISNA